MKTIVNQTHPTRELSGYFGPFIISGKWAEHQPGPHVFFAFEGPTTNDEWSVVNLSTGQVYAYPREQEIIPVTITEIHVETVVP